MGGETAVMARSTSGGAAGLPDPGPQARFCREAARLGINSLLIDFVLLGWPKLDAMVDFGENVLPAVRELERAEELTRSKVCRA
jgi:hypothetical protein